MIVIVLVKRFRLKQTFQFAKLRHIFWVIVCAFCNRRGRVSFPRSFHESLVSRYFNFGLFVQTNCKLLSWFLDWITFDTCYELKCVIVEAVSIFLLLCDVLLESLSRDVQPCNFWSSWFFTLSSSSVGCTSLLTVSLSASTILYLQYFLLAKFRMFRSDESS